MFSTTGLFKNITCPNGIEKCKLVNCVFSHEVKVKLPKAAEQVLNGVGNATSTVYDAADAFGDRKRRKLDKSDGEVTVPAFGAPFVGLLAPKKKDTTAQDRESSEILSSVKLSNGSHEAATPRTERSISPPLTVPQINKVAKISLSTSVEPIAPIKKPRSLEKLSPRSVLRDPAPFMTRYALLQKLHEAMSKLNSDLENSPDKETAPLHLSTQSLIVMALEEEEHFAKTNPSVYVNLVKLRIVAFKKMKLEEWIAIRLRAAQKVKGLAVPKLESLQQSISLETELATTEQLEMLNRFILKPEDLRNAGYVVEPPTDAEAKESRKAVEASANYEQCDRCGTRFQVFPDRREEDGALTTQGKCQHHWGKPRRQGSGLNNTVYTCCKEPPGTPGCTIGETHVFKITGANRLASILHFQKTPINASPKQDVAIAFDCEMAYTCYGLEVVRLSATTWPNGEALIDVLVRPLGQILDLNTRFSGITPEMFFNATEYNSETDTSSLTDSSQLKAEVETQSTPPLQIVSSPAAARSLLLSYISTNTVLIGHSLDNDMNVLRLIHPTIVDTSLLFSHPIGLPYRYGLKNLVKQFLNREVQTAGADGHDSVEDSRAAGDLVRWKIANEWASLKGQGWSVKDGQFFGPGNKQDAVDLPVYAKSQSKMKKRKAENSAA